MGAVITSKLAQLAKVGVGDDLRIDGHTIRVAAITENYVGHFVYMNQATYQKTYGEVLRRMPIWSDYSLLLSSWSRRSVGT